MPIRASADHLRRPAQPRALALRSEEHTSELQSPCNLVCRLLLEKKKTTPWTVPARGIKSIADRLSALISPPLGFSTRPPSTPVRCHLRNCRSSARALKPHYRTHV